ncbi:hypothetical protein A3C23_02530 [Candidatus Roizmanbacteria bacterium RIFCSPHIGHO2_02_FULL_37_13b]|uniref:Aspartyl/glutamyl-tRNA(Asn/Gln) amidotransferase subunit C n=1 Tax=Candidatus Roizmanbacteria bacterium RIFCSPLOWO2_02_FULL_36_11 TaxID=1802071 RepID=A0A1F7JG45_9BACT|nr:MAG: hypothetical protein A3C23_02530 [Candidatus Roizmanbacteria bacterium RIFCSPHIGHO2_02_FULL_37_13b]OGK54552.1 MAG: hypothetical protein A3H78_01540 [Candidatus Roizmanbacteria bacterium RIFCSPLOWO2_02_FULL_36_11]
MTKTKHLTKSDLIHLMELSKLQLNDSELLVIEKQLNETLDYFENLGDLDTSAISEATYTTSATNVFRDDSIDESRLLDQSTVFKNAKKKKNNFFIVSRII